MRPESATTRPASRRTARVRMACVSLRPCVLIMQRATLRAQARQRFAQPLLPCRVQARGRLIQEQQPRSGQQRARDGQALAHAARKSSHQIGVPRPPSPADSIACATRSRGESSSVQSREEQQIFLGGQVVVQERAVRDQAHSACAGSIRAGKLHPARAGTDQPRRHLQQRGLAGTVCSHQADRLARSNPQGNPAQGESHAVALFDLLELDTDACWEGLFRAGGHAADSAPDQFAQDLSPPGCARADIPLRSRFRPGGAAPDERACP